MLPRWTAQPILNPFTVQSQINCTIYALYLWYLDIPGLWWFSVLHMLIEFYRVFLDTNKLTFYLLVCMYPQMRHCYLEKTNFCLEQVIKFSKTVIVWHCTQILSSVKCWSIGSCWMKFLATGSIWKTSSKSWKPLHTSFRLALTYRF